SGHFDYSIEEQLDRETSIKQMVVDMKTIKVNSSKTLIKLDDYGIQNESEKGDFTLKRISSEIHIKINPMQKDEITDIPNETLACQIRKNLSFYGRLMNNQNTKGKRIVTGSNTIKIINRRGFSSLRDNTHIEEIKPIKNPFVGLKEKAKIEIESNETYSKVASSQKVPQINMLLQEILKRLET
ncbi:27985_t:CDS:2, partial [Gigaspora margarita]